MTREHLKVPEPGVREMAHELAYKLARERLAAIEDIELQCEKAGARWVPESRAVEIDHLARSYRIDYPGGGVSYADSDEAVPVRDKILILDYFTRARGTPLTGRLITYKELHDGINYFSVFSARTIRPIVKYFGDDPEKLLAAAGPLGGKRAEPGDVSVTIDAFPRVPVTIVLWQGDSEFPAEGSILFDSTVSDYLTNDDIHTLCENITWKLARLSRSGGDGAGNR